MDQNNLSLDLLLQETLALSEYLRASSTPAPMPVHAEQTSFLNISNDINEIKTNVDLVTQVIVPIKRPIEYPKSAGVIYKIDSGASTFCVRGFTTTDIKQEFDHLEKNLSDKKSLLKLENEDDLSEIVFFPTQSIELAEAIKEQIINRRFPHQEDAVCNISDPGFSWWMDSGDDKEAGTSSGRFEIFFRAHSVNRAEKYIQLGPIGDGAIAALRMNQARNLLRSSFPISEYSCDEKSFTVASQKPDHLSFASFKNIFLLGENNTQIENFPDNSVGRALYYYFHELAIVRKFWIEVKTKLG